MAYTAYESAANEALAGVASLCKHLTSGGSFSTTTQPTLAEVERWLTVGWRTINTVLADFGYEVPASPGDLDADCRGALEQYNVWYAAAQAEFSQPSAGFSPEGGARGDKFMAMFWGTEPQFPGIRRLCNSEAFQKLGATKAAELTAALSAGGTSKSDRSDIREDTDHIPYSFKRGQFDNPGYGAGYTGRISDTRADL